MIYKLHPVYKDYIWGGTRLRDEYGKDCDLDKVAESWELACHKDGVSLIAPVGADRSEAIPIDRFIEENGKEAVLGTRAAVFDDFPVLIKLIDAKDDLSVQVHPGDAYARKIENSPGKTELWYIIDCDEGAELLYGFERPVSREEVEAAALNGTLPELAHHVPVRVGDVFWIEAGTLHAIGKGVMVAEIQQNSNVTYRLYDYDRVGPDGNKRELHLQKALDVLKYEQPQRFGPLGYNGDHVIYDKTLLGSCDNFNTVRIDTHDCYNGVVRSDSFHVITVVAGELTIKHDGKTFTAKNGESYFLPANAGDYQARGYGKLLITSV